MICSYLEKFTEFLSLFVSIHLKRFEPNNHFPTAELLDLLTKYTVLQVNFMISYIVVHYFPISYSYFFYYSCYSLYVLMLLSFRSRWEHFVASKCSTWIFMVNWCWFPCSLHFKGSFIVWKYGQPSWNISMRRSWAARRRMEFEAIFVTGVFTRHKLWRNC